MNKVLIAFLTIVLAACGSAQIGDDSRLEAKAFKQKMEEAIDFNLIDVRSAEEFAMNHIAKANNLDVNSSSFKTEAAKLDQKKPVLVYCKSGNRSATAASTLKELGFTVYELEGGILKWQTEGFDVETSGQTYDDGYTLARYNAATTESPLVLVDFHATWCGPCRMMAPHIEALQKKYSEQLTVIKVDTDKSIEVSKHFKISGIPLVKLYKNGKEVYDKTGYHSLEELQKMLDKHL